MLKKIFIFLFFAGLICGVREVSADDSPDSDTGDDESGISAVATVCDHLQEKIQIILPLTVQVREDFARVSDPYLCRSMSNQCEYFYTLAKLSQKEYRDTCDTHYQIVKVEKCDYSANPCVKEINRLTNFRHALVESGPHARLETL